jgi:hypothetical protein
VNNGSGTNNVSSVSKRQSRQPGRSVRHSSTAAAMPSGMDKANVPIRSKMVLRANVKSRDASAQTCQAERSLANSPSGAANGTASNSNRNAANATRQRIIGPGREE